MAISNETLKSLLLKDGIVTESDFKRLEADAKRSDVPITRLLISEGLLNERYLTELLSRYLNIPIFTQQATPLNPKIINIIPEMIARQRQVLVIGKDEKKNKYTVAMVDPTDIDNLNFLKEYLHGEIEPMIIIPQDLRIGYQIYKRQASEGLEASIAKKIKELTTSLKRKSGESILESVPLTELFDAVVDYAAILEASDVYLQPEEDVVKVRFRIDGLLHDILSVDQSINDGLVARVKTLSQLRLDEHLKPQDGRFRFRSSNIDLDIRTAIMPTLFGEKTTMRLLASAQSFLSFEELGIEPKTIATLQAIVKQPYGMILSCGPTGSGKTTTIYSVLTRLNKPEVHITTIEDPIEYIMPNVSQTQVNIKAEVTFASGLRALLRHSPDIVFIGEIRDAETADVSVNAALTGHLLISTIHTNDATSTVIRLIDMGIPPFLISATLNAALAQRLVRKICQHCIESRVATKTDVNVLEAEFKKSSIKASVPKTIFRGKGCEVCGFSGYKGRTGIFELFVINDTIRDLMAKPNLSLDELRDAAKAQGMTTMLEDGVSKVERGATTIEELLRVISEQ